MIGIPKTSFLLRIENGERIVAIERTAMDIEEKDWRQFRGKFWSTDEYGCMFNNEIEKAHLKRLKTLIQ